MNIPQFKRLAVPLLLMTVLWLPGVWANTIEDSAGNEWTASAVEVGDQKQILVRVVPFDGSPFTFYATDVTDERDNLWPFLFASEIDSRVWVVWGQERVGTQPGLFEIWLNELYIDFPPDHVIHEAAEQVTKVTDSAINDRNPVAGCTPDGPDGIRFHVAFRRDITDDNDNVLRKIYYKNNIPGDSSPEGLWNDGELEINPPEGNREGTEPKLLVGNNANGSPVILIFREWATYYELGAGSKTYSYITATKRVTDGSDPTPWERLFTKLPANPPN